MSEPTDDPHSIHSQWLVMRPVALWLTLAWALVTFVPPLFAPDVLEVAGEGAAVWIAALVGPLAYVVLAWWYERRADRADRQRQRSQRDG
ncbi:MAG: sodium/substrate symporter small subunit [Burkholderiales bacterium]